MTVTVTVALPVAVHVLPVRATLLPAVSHPHVPGARRDPASAYPDVLVAVPAVVSGRPYVTGSGRDRLYYHRRGRRADGDADADTGVGMARDRHQYCAGGNQQANQKIFSTHESPPFPIAR